MHAAPVTAVAVGNVIRFRPLAGRNRITLYVTQIGANHGYIAGRRCTIESGGDVATRGNTHAHIVHGDTVEVLR